MSDNKFLSTSEVADMLGVTDATLAGWRKNNEGPPFFKFGKKKMARVRYRLADVEAWLESSFHDTTA